MYSILGVVLQLILLLQPCPALPFGKTSNNKESEDAANVATKMETVSVRGAAAKVSSDAFKSSSDPLVVVDTFFSSSVFDEKASSEALQQEIRKMANGDQVQNFLSTTRRALHRHPELMFQESLTSDTIQAILKELNISYTTGWAKNIHQDVYPGPGGFGIVAHIGTQREDQPCIILRADMDALPIEESTRNIESFKSLNKGKMHACGHDGHITMLLGAGTFVIAVIA